MPGCGRLWKELVRNCLFFFDGKGVHKGLNSSDLVLPDDLRSNEVL